MICHNSPAALVSVVSCLLLLSAALHPLFVDGEGRSVDLYRESAGVSHETNTEFCPAQQFGEFLPRAVDKEGNISLLMASTVNLY